MNHEDQMCLVFVIVVRPDRPDLQVVAGVAKGGYKWKRSSGRQKDVRLWADKTWLPALLMHAF